MTRSNGLVAVSTYRCMLCGRSPGQLVDGVFAWNSHMARPRVSVAGISRCGDCGGNLYLEADRAISAYMASQVTRRVVQAKQAESCPADVVVGDGEHESDSTVPVLRVVSLRADTLKLTPEACNSRVVYDAGAIEELAESIRQHGVLQPILVRPQRQTERLESPRRFDGQAGNATFVVIAGNRRLLAARRAELSEVPCVIKAADTDDAFVLNIVENLQRRELSGRERVRAITLLASLTASGGRPLGIREISRKTGLAPTTISAWLRVERRPALKAALMQERLDIGRAMKLVAAPDVVLETLIERAAALSQKELSAEVVAARAAAGAVAERQVLADERRAEVALRAVLLIESIRPPVRERLECVYRRIEHLLCESRAERDAPQSHVVEANPVASTA